MKTLPEQIQELEGQIAAHAATVEALNATHAAVLTERDALLAEKSASAAEIIAVRAENDALKGQVSSANAESTKLKGEMKSAEELAVAIMARVGQPTPVSADTTGGNKPSTAGAKPTAVTGLNRVAAFFADKRAGN